MITSVLETSCKRFRENATQENFKHNHDPQM